MKRGRRNDGHGWCGGGKAKRKAKTPWVCGRGRALGMGGARSRAEQIPDRGREGDLGRHLFCGARRAVVLVRVSFGLRGGGAGGLGDAGNETLDQLGGTLQGAAVQLHADAGAGTYQVQRAETAALPVRALDARRTAGYCVENPMICHHLFYIPAIHCTASRWRASSRNWSRGMVGLRWDIASPSVVFKSIRA